MNAFDADLARGLSRKHYAALCAHALPDVTPAEVERRFASWLATHFSGDATRASATETWFQTVLAKAAARGCALGDAVALDFLRFSKLVQTTAASATWMDTPWLKAIRTHAAGTALKGEGWKRADDVGLGLFRWDWSTLKPADVRKQKIAPRPVWLVVMAKAETRVHELSETLGLWLSAFPRLAADHGARQTEKYRRACADATMLAQAQKLGLIVRVPEAEEK